MSLVRNPALWTGLALIALGGGNWINGQVKLAEYEAVASHPPLSSSTRPFDEFVHLDENTNAALLEPLRSRLTTRSLAEGKRDFYAVVLTGGRLLTLLGAFLVVATTYWERRRTQPRAA
jgi:hypothetical protein